MFDPRITLQQQVSEQLKAHFGSKVFDTVIPRNVRLAEAPSHGLPGVVFDPSAKGSQAFVAFATEMVARVPAMAPVAIAPAKAAVAPATAPRAARAARTSAAKTGPGA
ncbi:MAG: ParA family protein, partial [Giesbergeria sp.]|nr:ParA family protein [Giesbergeria sp.]